MSPYKGILRISCKGNCPDKLTQLIADCISCERSTVEVLDLDGNTIAIQKAEVKKRKLAVRKKGTPDPPAQLLAMGYKASTIKTNNQ